MATSTETRQAKPADMADVLASAEAKVNEETQANEAKIALIDDQLPALKARVQDARDGVGQVADIETRWRGGEDVPASEYVLAQAEDAKAQVLVSGLTAKRNALVQNLSTESKVIAERVKPLLEWLLPGVSVFATNAPLRTFGDAVPRDAAGVVVVQEPGHEVERSTGALSGKVSVFYYRFPVYGSINVAVLEQKAKEAGVSLEVTSNAPAGGSVDPHTTVCDRLTIKVSNVFDGLPSIEHVDTSGLHSREWVTSALRRNGSHPSGVPVDRSRYTHQWKVETGPHAWVTGQPAEVQRQEVSNDRRTVVVSQKVNTHNVDPVDFVADLRAVLSMQIGTVSGGLGLLEAAEVSNLSESRADRTANAHLTLTYASKAPGAEQAVQQVIEDAETDGVDQARDVRATAAIDRRDAASKRLHPGEQAAAA